MSAEKISSDEVPGKFTEWLLAMGCPADKVPSVENMREMCRGQYYMVWRSLMEQVEAKDVVRRKRLQVFCDDIRKCQKKNVFKECENNTVVPEQLTLWRQQADIRQKVSDATTRVALARKDLDQIMDKNCSKMAQRNQARNSAESAARRACFLRGLAEELRSKTDALRETREIADSICSTDDDGGDIQSKLDKCLSSFQRQSATLSTSNTTTGAVAVVNGDADFEQQAQLLSQSRGGALCRRLYERRAAILRNLTAPGAAPTRHGPTPQSVLARTAALHCTLSLEATKNKIHLKQARKKLMATVSELNNYLSGPACELLVIRCEVSALTARVSSARSALHDVTAGGGAFGPRAERRAAPAAGLAASDHAIETKKEELKHVMSSLCTTERKLQSVRDCLNAVFTAFQGDASLAVTHYTGVQLDLPSESMGGLRQFYESHRERRRQKVDVSLELEASDGSITDNIDFNNPRFVDELRLYLKNFSLESNRQLVLESGEKVWIFETAQASIDRLHSRWLSDEMSCDLLCPADGLSNNVARLLDVVKTRDDLEAALRELGTAQKAKEIDIKPLIEEEADLTDRIKKRLRESQQELQKASKTFTLGQDNLKLWSENQAKKYIQPSRKVDGMTYRDYEIYYFENCLNI